jgi:hypothetical protein
MKWTPLLISFLLIARASAQVATPSPKKEPFTGFGGTALDRKKPGNPATGLPQRSIVPPGTPAPANPAAGSDGLKLRPGWDSPTGLSRGGPLEQRKELRALLNGFAAPGRDTSPDPQKRIYKKVTYLLPFEQARSRLGLSGALKSGGKSPVVGFPDGGLTFEAFTSDAGRAFETRLLQDAANQVVALEFVALDASKLPEPPDPLPDSSDRRHELRGKTFDFVSQGTTAVSKTYSQVSWNVGDYVLISTRGGPRVTDLYIPKPMVSFILYCLDRPARQ